MSKRTPKAFSAYRVTVSTVPGIEVGQILIDKGVVLRAEWNFINFDTGVETSAVGKRVGRCCVTCRLGYARVANLGHEGSCGADAPKFIAEDEESSLPPGEQEGE